MLLVLHLISPRMLGFGDVRLATLVGLALGWCGWEATYPRLGPVQAVLNAGLLAGLIGSVAGVVLLVQRRRDRPFPFGPAVAISGALVALAVI
jgi:leader peptidase (prepilin peptidase)/N-methyltransferase